MKQVLFVGDINVDVMMGGLECFPVLNKEITCTSYETTMGSSAVIAACAYASLGGATHMLGLAGNDAYGNFMVEGMEALGIHTDMVRRTDRVRTGVTVNMTMDDTRTQVTYPGTISEFEGSDLMAADLEPFDMMLFAGPYQQTKFRPEIARLLALAKDVGVQTALDPQWDATENWEHMNEWLPLLTYFFVNEDEARSLTQVDDLAEACRLLTERTACPIVKAGKDGALVSVEGQVTAVPSWPVDPVDTTGAGDSFDAGFLYARLEDGLGLVDAVRFGNAVGARSCLSVGGVNAKTTREQAKGFMEKQRW